MSEIAELFSQVGCFCDDPEDETCQTHKAEAEWNTLLAERDALWDAMEECDQCDPNETYDAWKAVQK